MIQYFVFCFTGGRSEPLRVHMCSGLERFGQHSVQWSISGGLDVSVRQAGRQLLPPLLRKRLQVRGSFPRLRATCHWLLHAQQICADNTCVLPSLDGMHDCREDARGLAPTCSCMQLTAQLLRHISSHQFNACTSHAAFEFIRLPVASARSETSWTIQVFLAA